MTTDAAPVAGIAVSFRRHPKVRIGLILLALFIAAAASHPLLRATLWSGQGSVYHPERGYDRSIAHPSGPTGAHLLGTDAQGRDVLSLLTFALAPSLMVALLVAVAVGVSSIGAGSVAAYFRGPVDRVITHLSDALSLIPPPIALLVVGLARPFGPVQIGLLYGLLYGLGPATTVVRSRALQVMAKPFIDGARIAGGGPRWLIKVHLIPDLLPYAGVQMMAGVTGGLITQAFIEFFGSADTRIGLGSLVYLGISYVGTISGDVAWSQLLAGALAISLLAGTFYLVAVGIREVIDPRYATER
jgi:peptide/nickel transport system permease protein